MLLLRSQGRNINEYIVNLFVLHQMKSILILSFLQKDISCVAFLISICSPATFQLLTASTRPTASPMANSDGILNFFGIMGRPGNVVKRSSSVSVFAWMLS